MYARTQVCVYIYGYVNLYAHASVCIYACVGIYGRSCSKWILLCGGHMHKLPSNKVLNVWVCVRACVCMCVCVCKYVCVRVCVCVCVWCVFFVYVCLDIYSRVVFTYRG